MIGSDPKQTARDLLTDAHPALVGLSHWIHANPELGYQEFLSSGWVADWMTSAGFEVRRNVAGMETALAASFGPGPFHVALCAEYDALPSVGHACGHNVIAAASVGAAIALASVAEELGLRVTLFGTPAEEGGGGKLVLIEAGEFDGVHAALMVHPGPDDILEPEILGVRTLTIAYTGREAHAAGFPELGINAADALTIAQVAIGLLRQHLDAGDRVHGIVTKGGDAPNIVPAHTTAKFMVRSRTRDGLDALTQRVAACFEAGALATGAALELTPEVAYSPMLHDPDLVAFYQVNAEATGRWFDPSARMVVSTDMGDVSHVVPSIHPMIGIDSRPFVNHQPEFADAAVAPAADQAIFDGALLLAWTVIDAATSGAVRERLTGSAWVPDLEASSETESGDDAWATAQDEDTPADAGFDFDTDASADADSGAYAGWAGEPGPATTEIAVTETISVTDTIAVGDDAWPSEDEVVAAENAAEVAWAPEAPAAAAWEGEQTADDVEPESPAEPETPPEPEPSSAPEPSAEAEAWSDAETLPVAEAYPQATPPATTESTGEDYAQWEADFAAALDSLDHAAGSSSSEAGAEDEKA